MTFITIFSAILSILKVILQQAQQRGWMDQGVAEALLRVLGDADDVIAKAGDARKAESDREQRDPSSVLSDDGFKRKD